MLDFSLKCGQGHQNIYILTDGFEIDGMKKRFDAMGRIIFWSYIDCLTDSKYNVCNWY